MKKKLFGNIKKKDKLTIIFICLYIFTVIIGGILIYQVLNPAPPPKPINKDSIYTLGFLIICASFLIHGFHPLLLVKK